MQGAARYFDHIQKAITFEQLQRSMVCSWQNTRLVGDFLMLQSQSGASSLPVLTLRHSTFSAEYEHPLFDEIEF